MDSEQGKLKSAGEPGPFILQQQPQEIKPIPERFTLQGSGKAIQRQKIDDTFELVDMKRSDSAQQLVVQGQPEAMIYPMNTYKTVVADADSYEELVKNEAKEIADIGEEASSSKVNPVVEQTSSKKSEFSRKENNPLASGGRKAKNRVAPSLIDVYYKTRSADDYWPFKLRLEGKWDGDEGKGARNIEITFSNSGYGYTTKVEGATGAPYVAKPDAEATGARDFPMTHAFDETGTVNVSASAKALANKGDADATSKVISEGARWISVRNKAEQGNLKDTTRFYPDGYYSANSVVPSVSFKELWNSWNSIFNKEWNISEEVLIEKLEKRILQSATSPTYGALAADLNNYPIPRATPQEKDDIDAFLAGPLAATWNRRDKGEERESGIRGTKGIRIGVSSVEQDAENEQEGGTKLDNYGRSVNIFKNEEEHAEDPANFFYTLTHELALHAIPHQLDEAATHIHDHDAIIDYSRGYFVNTVRPAARALFDNENAGETRNPNFPTCDSFLAEFLIDIDTSVKAFRGNYISDILDRNGSPEPNDQYQTPQNIAAFKTLVENAWSTMDMVTAFCEELEVAMPSVAERVIALKEMFTPILDLENDADVETVLVVIADEVATPDVTTVVQEDVNSDEDEEEDDDDALLASAFGKSNNRFTFPESDDDSK
jgi:hypothetical protein